MNNYKHLLAKALVTAFVLICATTIRAQFVRTSYFMDGANNKLQLNPALRPTRGYINIPVVGAVHIGSFSNTLGIDDIYEIRRSRGVHYNLHDDLFDRIEDTNWFNALVNLDVISFGFYKGKGFWSANAGLRIDFGGSLPRSKFEFMRYMHTWNKSSGMGMPPTESGSEKFSIRNASVDIRVYNEIGVGYSYPLNEKLTVGAKAKVLLGMADVALDIDRLDIEQTWWPREGGEYWQHDFAGKADRDIRLKASMGSIGILEKEYGGEYIDALDFSRLGIAGYGLGVDLGFTYQLKDRLTVSASLIDLGFITWEKGSTQIAGNQGSETYDRQFDGGGLMDYHVLKLIPEKSRMRTTSLATTLVMGAEYGFLNDVLSAGILSTTRFGRPKVISEITLSGNYRPKSWVDISLSYSVFHSEFKTFGFALRMGPVFVGTDYILNVGQSGSRSANAYLGISIPLGREGVSNL